MENASSTGQPSLPTPSPSWTSAVQEAWRSLAASPCPALACFPTTTCLGCRLSSAVDSSAKGWAHTIPIPVGPWLLAPHTALPLPMLWTIHLKATAVEVTGMGVWCLQTSCLNPSGQPCSPSLPGQHSWVPLCSADPGAGKGRRLLLGPSPPALSGEPSQEGEAARGLRSPKAQSLTDRPLKPPAPTAKLQEQATDCSALTKGFTLTFSVPPSTSSPGFWECLLLQEALREHNPQSPHSRRWAVLMASALLLPGFSRSPCPWSPPVPDSHGTPEGRVITHPSDSGEFALKRGLLRTCWSTLTLPRNLCPSAPYKQLTYAQRRGRFPRMTSCSLRLPA